MASPSGKVPIPESMKSFANPAAVGKGCWYMLYVLVSEIKTFEDREHVKYAVECLQRRFHCLKCRRHFDEYCQAHPLNDVLYADDPKEIFNWVYKANSAANTNAGKYMQPLDDFHTFFYEDVICDHNCGGTSPRPLAAPAVKSGVWSTNQPQATTIIQPPSHRPFVSVRPIRPISPPIVKAPIPLTTTTPKIIRPPVIPIIQTRFVSP